jgi:hypothetical protein
LTWVDFAKVVTYAQWATPFFALSAYIYLDTQHVGLLIHLERAQRALNK